ncbi:pyridine nucleotide disulphide reductase class-i signature [Trichococcus palustris]|uniref:Pyridine nucleotide disulphide reductase class-i signature n=1 Tax=Trichococcus palustris TaxID=140314 RepID=A0A143YRL2_9LACT|nr:CoA-disulfide reductase [Trichococcus palustris]CZQ96436.1 pyridine nucleotide disulphide reductase class-i signature [Trichococcus palustris]SFK73505.1 CoA-disulfide reductase [Trichococcus palustris]
MKRKIVIIGGVAGGATAAARLRRLNEEDEIVIFEKGEYISFANCGLPYYIGGTIQERDNLLLETVGGMAKKFNVDIKNFSEVIKINRDKKTISVKNVQTNTITEESYDKLIISTGAKPIKPAIDGINKAENVFTLRNIPDMDKIKAYINEHQVKKATVIGGGFIGLEMMENLWDLGIQVSLVEMSDQVMAPIDFEMAQSVHAHIDMHNVNLILNDGVKAFENNGSQVRLNSGKVIPTDMTILSIGVMPENNLALDAKLETGVRGAIVVNDQLQTSDPDIFAVGDVIEVTDFVNGSPTVVPLAWPANRQGRLVADHLNGMDVRYKGTMGTSVAKVFELTVASAGNNEKTLKRVGTDYKVVHIHPNSHAGYYPGASPLDIKLLFGLDGKILGVQAVGMEGVEKRVDVIATAMKLGATVYDLPDLELAYAPPYSSAKDPANIAGYVASNILEGTIDTFQWHEVDVLIKKGAFLLDVREDFEWATGVLGNAYTIPLGDIRDRMSELPKDETIYVFCQVGHRGYNAARILMQNGFTVKNLDGGFKTYKQANTTLTYKEEIPEAAVHVQPAHATAPAQAAANTIQVDACGLQCPGPILKVKENMDKMVDGQELIIEASDFGFLSDIASWTKNTGNTLISKEIDGKIVRAHISKGKTAPAVPATPVAGFNPTAMAAQAAQAPVLQETKDGATMVVFSGDLDKALASFIIANGAAAYGKQVTMFFTFWGLNVIKRPERVNVAKRGMERMFDIMLPNHAGQLPISKMNMSGVGSKMIQAVMKQKNVDSLPVMIAQAQKMGVKMVACTMSMDIMGIKEEEIIAGVDFGGVATYIGDTMDANLNLFI